MSLLCLFSVGYPLKVDMLLLRTLAPWLLLAFLLGQQVCLSSGARNKTRGADKTGNKGATAATAATGKFSLKKNQMQCTWGARDEGGAVQLSVRCENPKARVTGGVTDMKCEYYGKPQGCPGFQSDPKGFWKQVARAVKRLQDKVCTDQRAQVKAGMCKRAPRDAHFKLDITSSVMAAQSGDMDTDPPRPRPSTATIATTAKPTNCTRADHQKKAEQYCSSSWASVCSFFFSMVQGNDC